MIDIEKANRELTRWIILQTTHVSGSAGTSESTLAIVLQNIKLYQGGERLRRELDYLAGRALIDIEGRNLAPEWGVKLTRVGYDLVDYTIECEPGIARPQKYWSR